MNYKTAWATAALLTLTVCGSAEAADKVKLTAWSWDIAAVSLKNAAQHYQADHPDVEIEVTDLGQGQVYDKILASCSADGADLPDVLTLEYSQAAVYLAQFPQCFSNLSAMGFESLKNQYPAVTLPDLMVKDAVYGIPWDTGPAAMFYNRALFKQAGVDADAIETWDDYIEAGKKVVAASGGRAKMAMSGHTSNDEWFWMMATENGCAYFNADASAVTVNQPGCVAALETFKKIFDAGLLSAGGWDDKLKAAKAGTAASIFYGAWYAASIEETMPDQKGNWGVFLPPAFEKGGLRAANYGGSALAIAGQSKNAKAAYDFAVYAAGDREQEDMLARGHVPAKLSALTSEIASKPLPYWNDQKIWQVVLGTMDKAPVVRGTRWGADATQIFVPIQNRYLNGEFASAKAALDEAANEISSATGLPVAE